MIFSGQKANACNVDNLENTKPDEGKLDDLKMVDDMIIDLLSTSHQKSARLDSVSEIVIATTFGPILKI